MNHKGKIEVVVQILLSKSKQGGGACDVHRLHKQSKKPVLGVGDPYKGRNMIFGGGGYAPFLPPPVLGCS